MGAEVQLGRVCEFPPVQTGYKRTRITIVTCVTCAASSHGRAGDWANGHDRGNAAIRARLLSIAPAAGDPLRASRRAGGGSR
jgi:hypothetical protein